MTNLELVEKCLHYATLPNYYDNKTTDWMQFKNGKWAGDCIRTPKALIYWGWKEDKNAKHGGAVYNAAYDFTEQAWINHCTKVSQNFGKIEKGELLMMPGHCGIYLGSGRVFEVTVAWNKNGAVISDISNTGYRTLNGVPAQSCWWKYHGQIPEIEYIKEEDDQMTYAQKRVLQASAADIVLKRGCGYKEHTKFLQEYLAYFGYYKGTIDGDFGYLTENALRDFQKAKGLYSDGICGAKTWAVILEL